MALIRCPECDKEISSTAPQCIHCGAKFTACPECGEVFLGEAWQCPSCGYVIKEEAPIEPDEEKTQETAPLASIEDLQSEWEAGCAAKKSEKTLRIVWRVCNVVGWVLFFGVIFLIAKGSGSITFAIARARGWILFCFILKIVGSLVFNVIKANLESRILCAFPVWLRKKGIDIAVLFDQSMNVSFFSMVPGTATAYGTRIRSLVLGEVYCTSPATRSSVLAKKIWESVLDTACAILALPLVWVPFWDRLCAESNLFVAEILVPGGILFAIGIVSTIVFTKLIEKQEANAVRDWVSKNAPEHLATYDYYIAHPEERITSRNAAGGSRDV